MPSRLVVLRRLVFVLIAALLTRSAFAFDPVTVSVCSYLATAIVAPLGYVFGCATAFSPPVRVFGDDEAVYGLDWGSLACHAGSVYGLQMSLCGGSFENELYGLQIGILASGYAVEKLPFDQGYHFCNLDSCQMNGMQIGTFAAKTATVNGLQIGLVTTAICLHGLQLGLYNSAEEGVGMQIGLLNHTESGLAPNLPIVNLVF